MFCFLISVYLAWNLCKRWKYSHLEVSQFLLKQKAPSPLPHPWKWGHCHRGWRRGQGQVSFKLERLSGGKEVSNTGCFCKTCKCGWGSPRWPCAQAFPEDSSSSFFSRGFLSCRRKPPSWSSGTPVMIMEISFRCLKEGPSCLVTSRDFGIN